MYIVIPSSFQIKERSIPNYNVYNNYFFKGIAADAGIDMLTALRKCTKRSAL
jgi:hypothetical protein